MPGKDEEGGRTRPKEAPEKKLGENENTPLHDSVGYAIIPPASPKRDKTNQQEKGQTMKKNQKSKVVAVRCEGCFTEWYSPNFKDPYEDNAEYREYYNNHVLPFQPVIGPSLGDANDEYLTSDLQCHAERMCCDAEDWDKATNAYADAIEQCIADGKPRTFKFEGLHDVKITPYTKENLPPVNEDSLGEYAEFKELIRERVAALYR